MPNNPNSGDLEISYIPSTPGFTSGMGMGMGMGMGPSRTAFPVDSEEQENDNGQYYGYGDEYYRDEWKDTLCTNEFILSYLPSVVSRETHVIPHYFSTLHSAIVAGEGIKEGKKSAALQLEQEKFELLRKQNDPGLSTRTYDIIRQKYDVVYVYEEFCGFSAYTHYHTYRLVQTFLLYAWYAVVHFKEFFRRQRPSFVCPELEPIIDVPVHPSYPSGHATQGYLVSLLLKEILPNRTAHFRQALLDLGKEVGEHREWAGVHYRSDTLAGQMLAKDIWNHIKQEKQLLHYTHNLIELARNEWYENARSQHNVNSEDTSISDAVDVSIREIYSQSSD